MYPCQGNTCVHGVVQMRNCIAFDDQTMNFTLFTDYYIANNYMYRYILI